jgi:hypothetical protein
MDLNSNEPIPTPSSECTPISVIKTKRLRPIRKSNEAQVTVQFFTPTVPQEKENAIAQTHKPELPGFFTTKSFKSAGLVPKNLVSSLSDKTTSINNII